MKLSWMRKFTGALGLLVIVAGMATSAKAVDPHGKAPELDPGSAASALTVVSGGLLILGSRRAKK